MVIRTRRVKRVQSALDVMPLRQDALKEAYEDFKMFGELPDHERLAQAVVDSAIAGELLPIKPPPDEADLIRLIQAQHREKQNAPPKERTLREYLLDHAGYAPPGLREPARLACCVLSAKGGDLTDPKFLANEPLPPHNGIGWHLLGYPQRLAKPPYVKQAQRLFARFDELRQRTPQDEDPWFDECIDVAVRFRMTGELPDEELMRDAVLADLEMECLVRHKRGHDVGELMAALDKAARTKGRAREDAIAAVQQLVRDKTRR
jgi:hypothetical protein